MPRIVGRYELYRDLAAGGMGTVCLGRLHGEGGFSRAVAIKKIHEHLAKDPEIVAMFLDEAKLASRVRHPNVVPTLDVVSTEGDLLLVMDYVHGESLGRLVTRARTADEPIPAPIASAIVIDALEGLHAAHEATNERGVPLQIVHRDVSPQNLLVGVDGLTRVLDFGVAKALERSASTGDAELKGKLAYMAPERIRRTACDARVDVWAMGVVLWELIANERLFPSDAAPAVDQIVNAELKMPGELGKSPTFDAVLRRALAREPDQRFDSARAMSLAVEAAMTRAPARDVGRWVRRVAKDSLSDRQRMIEEMEVQPPSRKEADKIAPSVSTTPPPLVESPLETGSEVGARRRSPLSGIAIVVGLLLAGALIYVGYGLRRPTVTASERPSETQTSTASASPPLTTATDFDGRTDAAAPVAPSAPSARSLGPKLTFATPPKTSASIASIAPLASAPASGAAAADPLERDRRQ